MFSLNILNHIIVQMNAQTPDSSPSVHEPSRLVAARPFTSVAAPLSTKEFKKSLKPVVKGFPMTEANWTAFHQYLLTRDITGFDPHHVPTELHSNTRRTMAKVERRLCRLVKTCEHCHEIGRQLRKCAGCRVVYYCSRRCQKNHWRHHQHMCKTADSSSQN